MKEKIRKVHIRSNQTSSADVLTVIADCGQIEQVMINLTANARDAMKQGGRITIETRMVDVAEGGPSRFGIQQAGRYVVISVSDTGAGMDEATQKKIFNPFFTTKEKGRGTGLVSFFSPLSLHNDMACCGKNN